MSFKSASFWWVECDVPDCTRKSVDESEYSAWADKSSALDEAEGSDWIESSNSMHFCHEHRSFVCGECGKVGLVQFDANHDSMCDECWAEDAKTNHGLVTS